jgi:hypothetical protein
VIAAVPRWQRDEWTRLQTPTSSATNCSAQFAPVMTVSLIFAFLFRRWLKVRLGLIRATKAIDE